MAVIERIVYGIGVKPYQILGMILIVCMSVLVSLSDLFGKESTETVVIVGEHMPIYKAVLYSLVFPIVGTSMTFVIKYANKTVRIASFDIAMAF